MIAKDLVRYVVEHRLVPHYTYETGLALPFSLMVAPQETMRNFFVKASKLVNNNVLTPACEFEETNQAFEVGNDRLLVVRVGMPTPKEALQCRAIYVCFSKSEGKRLCFTSELSTDGTYSLCAWTQDGAHLNLGKAPESAQDEIERVASLFWEVKPNGYKEFLKDLRAG